MCPCMWFTAINGISIPSAKDLANELPTSKDPNNPGPCVKQIADKSSFFIPASFIAVSTTGIMFC